MLSNNQTIEIKKQIIRQIDENFPADKRDFAKQQIQEMTNDEIEEFLKQNHLVKNEQNSQQCIFCSIVKEHVQSYKIDENDDAVAILEINPISKAHTLIIPKEHIISEQMPESILALAKKIAQKIKKQFAPKQINLFLSTLFNHSIINVLPTYTDENQNSKRKQANPDELLEIQEQLVCDKVSKLVNTDNEFLGMGGAKQRRNGKESTNLQAKKNKKEIIKKSKSKKLKNIKIPKRIP